MQTETSKKTKQLVQLSILIAVMCIFAFTPIGYLKIGIVEITFMIIPVAIGAILLGPAGGAILGGVFGITSFIQCFGMSTFGTFLFGIHPVYTFLVCFVPRVLCGWLSGLLYRWLSRVDKTRLISYFAASLATALLNTVFFMSALILLFWKNSAFTDGMNQMGISTDTLWIFLVSMVGVNGLVEAAVNFILGGTIAKTLKKLRFVQ